MGMKWKMALCLLLFMGLASPSHGLDYQVCTMKGEADFICNTRDQMRLYLQSIASNDKYYQEQIDKAGYCGQTYAENVREIRKYDSVKTPIVTDTGVKNIYIAWVKIQTKISDSFNDFFMATTFLNCK